MPELPEVENVRRTLAARIGERRVVAVEVRRGDVVTGDASAGALLAGGRVAEVTRHGKQLAMIGEHGRAVCVHLGMTGSLVVRAKPRAVEAETHTHVVWILEDGGVVAFRDPRRFGGVWTFATEAALREERWAALGGDALTIAPGRLAGSLSGKKVALKAALLDQRVVAGLGNIYVDELLFACRLDPLTPAGGLDAAQVRRLTHAMRRLLSRAIEAGGSTLRDYVDADGAAGGFQRRHRVYGRAGRPCERCREVLRSIIVAGRTTAFCGSCQANRAEVG